MKNTVSLIGLVVLAIFGSGCMAVNSGNVGKSIQPLPYATNEVSVIMKETTHTDTNGIKTVTVERTTKTGLAVNEGIQHGRLDMAKNVGIAQAKGSSGGFWSWLSTPAPYYSNGYGGGYYGTTSGSSDRGGYNYVYSH